MINPQCFEHIIMNTYLWKFVDHYSQTSIPDFKSSFLLFDWDEIFVVNFDDIETRSCILKRIYHSKKYDNE